MGMESRAGMKRRAARIIAILRTRFPDAHTALNWSTPLELLVATILSAQCTDKRVNIVTADLFRKYRKPEDYVAAPLEQFEQEIRGTGFFHSKAKAVRGACSMILSDFGGKVPDTMEELVKLPGVARKTANVVLGDAFNKIEADLMELVPRKDWTIFAHLLIYHGRATCTARKPDCEHCPLNKLCPSAFKV